MDGSGCGSVLWPLFGHTGPFGRLVQEVGVTVEVAGKHGVQQPGFASAGFTSRLR